MVEKAPWKVSWRGRTIDADFKTFKILLAHIFFWLHPDSGSFHLCFLLLKQLHLNTTMFSFWKTKGITELAKFSTAILETYEEFLPWIHLHFHPWRCWKDLTKLLSELIMGFITWEKNKIGKRVLKHERCLKYHKTAKLTFFHFSLLAKVWHLIVVHLSFPYLENKRSSISS